MVDDGTAAPSSHNVDVEAGLTAATAMSSHVFRAVMPWESPPSFRSVSSRTSSLGCILSRFHVPSLPFLPLDHLKYLSLSSNKS